LLERPERGERAILVHLILRDKSSSADFQEFKELALSAGAEIVASLSSSRQIPDSQYFIGSGKVEEIRALVASERAEIVLFDHSLTPAQQRNLEKALQCRVLDRTGLILDIFASRARSYEGKLQVEMAQLKYHSTRLVRGWTHLERQKGGIGLRGPGEKQLEVDRRLIRERIKYITKRLEKVRMQREQGRRARHRASLPTVSIVGYTNAGKSTLFNALTGADSLVANQLFATLDPTLRALELPQIGKVIFADTVGFVSKLPHDLVEAFQATLEEVKDSDLLLHVVDAHDSDPEQRIKQVEEVLAEIEALALPRIEVYNKIDLVSERYPNLVLDNYPNLVLGSDPSLILKSDPNLISESDPNLTGMDQIKPLKSIKSFERIEPLKSLERIGPLKPIKSFERVEPLGRIEPLERSASGLVKRLFVSALTGAGLKLLIEAIIELLSKDMIRGELKLAVTQARIRALLYEFGTVIEEKKIEDNVEGYIILNVALPYYRWRKLCQEDPTLEQCWIT